MKPQNIETKAVRDAPFNERSTRRPLLVLVGLSLLLALPGLAIAREFLLRDHLPVCFFRVTTGFDCPFCGLTRACSLGLSGDFSAAFGLNPLWPLAIAIMLLAGLLLTVDGLRGTSMAYRLLYRAMKSAWPLLAGAILIWAAKMLIRTAD